MRYERPQRLDDALACLADGPMQVAAGCTDLFAATQAKTLPGPVLDLTGLAELRGITTSAEGGLRIGGTTTWSDIVEADLPPALYALQQAARQVGARQVQNRATLAGNLCNASPAADGVPPLLILDAAVELRSARGTRSMPLQDFLRGPRDTALVPDEILAAITIPPEALSGASAFEKLGARAYLVISIAMIAVRLDVRDGGVASLAIAVGACGPVATRLTALEQSLIGGPISVFAEISTQDVARSLSPISDMRADAAYRLDAVGPLLRRTLARCAQALEVPA